MIGMGPAQVADMRTQIDVLLDAMSKPDRYKAYLAEIKDEVAKLAAENDRREQTIAAEKGKAEKNEQDRIANAKVARQAAIDRTAAEAILRQAKDMRERMNEAIEQWKVPELPHAPKAAA